MGETVTAQEVYCPDCGEDYVLAWSKSDGAMYVVCDCGEAEVASDFIDRFQGEKTDSSHESRGFY